MPDLERLTAADFTPHLHERFALAPRGGEPFGVELVEVAQLGEPTPERRAPFSLRFRSPDSGTMPQQIHRLEHAELGALELFLVPIGPELYEAIFT